ncbi:MAG: Ig-like domain-containing protein, partial [Bryobacteraceae bacterium]
MRLHPRLTPPTVVALLVCAAALAPLRADVGTGAPAPSVTSSFINAYFRNGFAYLVSLPPINDVTRFGPTGLVQEFRDVDRTANVRLALVRASTSPTITVGLDVAQVLANMYGYYSSVGPTTAGYPTADTLTCPAFDGNSCQYQFFSNSYLLFAYQNPTFNGQNFAVRAGFYTKWNALGGINNLGRATDIERAVTIQAINATVQLYANGAIYSITSGINNGRVFAVPQPYYALYQQNNGHEGFLGLPTSDEIILPDGRRRITFQGGNLESDGSSASLKLPVASVSLTPTSSGTIRLKAGETMELRAQVVAANGATLNDRVVTWTTSNGSVVTIQANGATATLRAVAAGSANIAASSEGKVSPVITAIVNAQCCQVGEGAPSATVAQAFVDAVTRLRLAIALPAQNPVRRVGAGYV